MITAVAAEDSKLKSLDAVLAYQNPRLVQYISKSKNISPDDVTNQLKDLYRWLWLTAKKEESNSPIEKAPSELMIGHELLFIDEMWHAFLLFTRDYQKFCSEYLGGVIHHDPMDEEVKESFRNLCETNPIAAREQRKKEIRPQLEFIQKHLGDEVLQRWYLRK